jgi:hypothetical protein
MRAHLFLHTLFFSMAIGSAFPQAAAEAALANGHSAAASSKVGAILGDSIKKANSRVAGSLSTASQPQPVPRASTRPIRSPKSSAAQAANTSTIRSAGSASAPSAASKGIKIVSIQGSRASTSSAATIPVKTNSSHTLSIQGGCASGSSTPSCPN